MFYFYTNVDQTKLLTSEGPLLSFTYLGCCNEATALFDPEEIVDYWVLLTPILRGMVETSHKIYLRRWLGQGLEAEDVRWMLTTEAQSVDFLSSWAGEQLLTEEQKTEWVEGILIPAMYDSLGIPYSSEFLAPQIRKDLGTYFYFPESFFKDGGPHTCRFFETVRKKETLTLLRLLAPTAFVSNVETFLTQRFPAGYTFDQVNLL